jgi:hypothetical protein
MGWNSPAVFCGQQDNQEMNSSRGKVLLQSTIGHGKRELTHSQSYVGRDIARSSASLVFIFYFFSHQRQTIAFSCQSRDWKQRLSLASIGSECRSNRERQLCCRIYFDSPNDYLRFLDIRAQLAESAQ